MSEENSHQETAENSASPATRKKKETAPSVESRKGVHFVLQGKGGVGKSLVASIVAQHLMEAGEPVICFDTDPVQQSMVAVEALKAEPIDLLDGDRLNTDAVDAMFERVFKEDSHVVADNGAASFVPVSSYLIRDGIVDLINEQAKRFIIHTVIVGGISMADTAFAARDLTEQFPACTEIVVWLNPFFGSLAGFEETDLYTEIKPRIAATIRLPDLDHNYSGKTFRKLLDLRLTFAQARESDEFTTIEKVRLARIWQPIKEQLAGVV